MSHTTVSAELLGLEGVEVDLVEREADGSWTVYVTAAEQQVCCTGCGQVAERVKQRRTHTLKHVTLVAMRVSWHKSQFWCENTECAGYPAKAKLTNNMTRNAVSFVVVSTVTVAAPPSTGVR